MADSPAAGVPRRLAGNSSQPAIGNPPSMITRPLDLGSKLRPPPLNFDWLFVANAGLLALFFMVFGSRFVLAPGLGVAFRLPTVAGANAAARPPTHVINVLESGQIFTAD